MCAAFPHGDRGLWRKPAICCSRESILGAATVRHCQSVLYGNSPQAMSACGCDFAPRLAGVEIGCDRHHTISRELANQSNESGCVSPTAGAEEGQLYRILRALREKSPG